MTANSSAHDLLPASMTCDARSSSRCGIGQAALHDAIYESFPLTAQYSCPRVFLQITVRTQQEEPLNPHFTLLHSFCCMAAPVQPWYQSNHSKQIEVTPSIAKYHTTVPVVRGPRAHSKTAPLHRLAHKYTNHWSNNVTKSQWLAAHKCSYLLQKLPIEL